MRPRAAAVTERRPITDREAAGTLVRSRKGKEKKGASYGEQGGKKEGREKRKESGDNNPQFRGEHESSEVTSPFSRRKQV